MPETNNEFINTCLLKLKDILSDPNALKDAVEGFQDKNTQTHRYCLNNITCVQDWTTEESTSFSAAVAKAMYQTLSLSVDKPQNIILSIRNALETFQTELIPELTQNTKKNNRLQCVIDNIDATQTPQSPISPNQSSFGFFAVAGLVAGIGVAYYALKK